MPGCGQKGDYAPFMLVTPKSAVYAFFYAGIKARCLDTTRTLRDNLRFIRACEGLMEGALLQGLKASNSGLEGLKVQLLS